MSILYFLPIASSCSGCLAFVDVGVGWPIQFEWSPPLGDRVFDCDKQSVVVLVLICSRLENIPGFVPETYMV